MFYLPDRASTDGFSLVPGNRTTVSVEPWRGYTGGLRALFSIVFELLLHVLGYLEYETETWCIYHTTSVHGWTVPKVSEV